MKKKIKKTKSSKNKDPFAAREAEKYENPIPSREFILSEFKKIKKPLKIKELAKHFKITDEFQIIALRRRVKAMVREDQLEQLIKKRFFPVGKRHLIKGIVKESNKKELVVVANKTGLKIYLPKFGNPYVVSNGDLVVVSVLDLELSQKKVFGKIVEVLEQAVIKITGKYIETKLHNYVFSNNRDYPGKIIIPKDKEKKAKDGDIVVVEILDKIKKSYEQTGKVIEILGTEKTPNIEIKQAVHGFSIPFEWSKELKQELNQFSKNDKIKLTSDRVDLTELPLVTIDGEDARDFDDAVYCEPKSSGGWRLYVAIADVSHYVKPGSSLDKEAQLRGNSVYFPSNVIPMLPEILSNGLCSLKPNENRNCMVCEMSITATGKISRYEFYTGVMNSKKRLTYTEVSNILEGINLNNYSNELIEDLNNLYQMYLSLNKQRRLRGAIEFETVETRIIFGKKGKIKDIIPVVRNEAHKIIEECMLCANVATAKFLEKHKVPGLYRNHEGPPAEKLNDLNKFLKTLGLSFGQNKKIKPIDYVTVLNKIKNRPDCELIQTILLRSLSQAVYSKDNIGHFGLAYPAYSHFTSPIRRYPDLIVHRQIKAILKNSKVKSIKKLDEIAMHCSMTERRADAATRDAIGLLKCQYISKHIGDIFDGVVSSVTKFGFFVELQSLYVEGLVHITNMTDDYYIFDSIHHKLVGQRTNKSYTLGTKVKVQVAKVDIDERKIDFVLINKKTKK